MAITSPRSNDFARTGAPRRRMSGAEILCECLVREGVEVVWGYPGGAVLPLYYVLPEFAFRHVLV
ncbi:MAG TPA: acetolactate synthase large subunit, partial [Chloroflexota bacterium]|nr:acetolactate synthase large subunit [Chloroflexota bacterium]